VFLIGDRAEQLKAAEQATHGPVRGAVSGVLLAYAAILFVEHPLVGLLFLGATFSFPNIGLAGLISALVGLGVARLLGFPNLASGLYIYNSLLVGLALGAFYQLDIGLLVVIVLSAALAVFVSAALADVLWQFGRLPVLSLPFVLVALMAVLGARSFGTLHPYVGTAIVPAEWFGTWGDAFLTAMGSVFFAPHPLAGLLLVVGIALRSRYLALLCVTGFAVGASVFEYLSASAHPHLLDWTGFNFALTAMALGGVFIVPSGAAFALAMVGAALAALLTAAATNLLLLYNLPVMALPFLLATLTLLAALRISGSQHAPRLTLERPALPELSYERARLARARLGEWGSVPLMAPVVGEWEVYQGFAGEHTHKDRWQHALDFYVVEGERSFHGDGTRLDDFHCFGLPVISPVFGHVVSLRDDLKDNAPGEVDVRHNWGNYVVLMTGTGRYVLLAHLRQDSIRVKEGDRVTPETRLAKCGNSGRSPQPHLHLQVQSDPRLGSATVPFHLTDVLRSGHGRSHEFTLVARPSAGERVTRAERDNALAAALHLPVGRTLRYRVTGTQFDEPLTRELSVELTLLGEFRLCSESGASAAIEEGTGVFALYDRVGAREPLLDMWLLGVGMCPLSSRAQSWRDAPAAKWLPLSLRQRLWLQMWRPLGAGLKSHYRRSWDSNAEVWTQEGEHRLRLGMQVWTADTRVLISPSFGCVVLELQFGKRSWRAELRDVGQIADRGVPAWEQAVPERIIKKARQETHGNA